MVDIRQARQPHCHPAGAALPVQPTGARRDSWRGIIISHGGPDSRLPTEKLEAHDVL